MHSGNACDIVPAENNEINGYNNRFLINSLTDCSKVDLYFFFNEDAGV